jgi:hypothetical protein
MSQVKTSFVYVTYIRSKGIQQGWPIVLSSLKSLLETGQGIDVFAKPKAA